jgi:predicted short-subunit dehydrogenase-like oxidoreductase (DUF2520 family)
VKIGIIGAGKVGTALGHALKEKGFDIVAVASRREASLETARKYIGPGCRYTLDNREVAELADVIAITTQDREIRNVAGQLFKELPRLEGKMFFHTSGAHPSSELSPLQEGGALLGSLHPLQTFPDIDAGIAVLPETYIFIEGDQEALPMLQLLASAIGFESLYMESKNKVLYHLSAVFVCNLLSALLYSAEDITKQIGIDLKPFYPIIRATLKNIESKGPLLSLTGPVVRGDAGTVASHLRALEALRGMALPEKVYKDLSLVALKMAEERKVLTADQLGAVKELLEKTTF